jgi:hypothetical protein
MPRRPSVQKLELFAGGDVNLDAAKTKDCPALLTCSEPEMRESASEKGSKGGLPTANKTSCLVWDSFSSFCAVS